MNMISRRGDVAETLKRQLRKHLTKTTTNLVINRACTRCGLRPEYIQDKDIPQLIKVLESILALYLRKPQIEEILNETRPGDFSKDNSVRLKGQVTIPITTDDDILAARVAAIRFCKGYGLGGLFGVQTATVVSELARNIFTHAGKGKIILEILERPQRGIKIAAQDEGPGIPDIRKAIKDDSSGGLSRCKKLMSKFTVDTGPHKGTVITAIKYCD